MIFPKRASPLWLGRYKLISRIGSGGMSEVYRAKLYGPGGYEKDVAIKILLPHLSGEQEFLKMLMDEARIASLLDHPNIVHIFELGEFEKIYYIAMEYVEGYDLRNILKIKGKLSEEIVLFILIETLKALEYAHSMKDKDGTPLNIVHRDISPQNILIRKDGIVKLTDFGIARARGRLTTTRTGFIKGKLFYMSPEQIEGKNIDRRSDLFSLALVIVELLTGEKVFEGETEGAIINSVKNFDPSGIAEKIKDKEWMKEVIKCLNREPELRPYSAGVLKDKIMKDFFDLYMKGEKALRDLISEIYQPAEIVEGKVIEEGDGGRTKTIKYSKKKLFYFLLPLIFIPVFLSAYFYYRPHKKAIVNPPQIFPEEITRPAEIPVNEKNEDAGQKPPRIQGKGFLSINTIPWTRVLIDGEDAGSTPILNMEVKAGKHRIKLFNEKFGIEDVIDVEVFQDKSTKIFKRLRKKSKF